MVQGGTRKELSRNLKVALGGFDCARPFGEVALVRLDARALNRLSVEARLTKLFSKFGASLIVSTNLHLKRFDLTWRIDQQRRAARDIDAEAFTLISREAVKVGFVLPHHVVSRKQIANACAKDDGHTLAAVIGHLDRPGNLIETAVRRE